MKVTIEKSREGHFYIPIPDEFINHCNLNNGDQVELLQRRSAVLVVPLPHKVLKNRAGEDTEQLYEVINKEFRGVTISYVSSYYLDFYIDEKTGKVDNSRLEKYYTKEQVSHNFKSLKEAYRDAIGSISLRDSLIDDINPNTLHDAIDTNGRVGKEEW